MSLEIPGGGFSLTSWFISEGLDFITTLFTGDWFGFIQRMLDPFDLWFSSVFSGRPAVGIDSATDDLALFYISSLNPVVALWGIGIRGLEARGIPISSSGGAGAAAYQSLARAVLSDLQRQFDNPHRPALNPGPVPFWPPGVPVTGQTLYNYYSGLGLGIQQPDSTRYAILNRAIVDAFYTILIGQKFIDPTTGWPFPIYTPPPPPPPPPGPNPPPQQIPYPQPQPPPGATEDEICCWFETQYGYWIAQAVQSLHQLVGQTSGPQAGAFTIAQALLTVAREITIQTNMIKATADPYIVAHLQEIATAVTALYTRVNPDFDALVNHWLPELVKTIHDLPTRIPPEKEPDLTPLIHALEKLTKVIDVPPATLDWLASEGYITPGLRQILGEGPFGASLVAIVRDYGWKAISWFLEKTGWQWDGHQYRWTGFNNSIHNWVLGSVDGALKSGSDPIYPVVKGAIDALVKQLTPTAAPVLGNVGIDVDRLLAETVVPIFLLNGFFYIADFLGWDVSEQFKEYTELFTTLVGFEEISELVVGARMSHGPIKAAELQAKRLFRQDLPGAGQIYDLAARGLITHGHAAALNGYNGIPDELHGPLQAAAYSGLNPRQLLRLSATGLFTDLDLADEMTFSGLRAVSQHRMLIAAPYLASDPERKQLRATLEKAYIDGFLTDAQLVQQLDDAEHNTSRDLLVLDRVRFEKRMSIAKELEAEYTALFLGGIHNDHTFRANLVGLGLQDDRVNALAAKSEARAAVTLARQEAAAARALARATAAEERKAAIRNYLQGNINATLLAAALVETGLTPVQASAWVDMAALQLAGAPKYKFGLRLGPDQAQLLTDRVRALDDQRKRQLITDLQFVDALKALKIPTLYINALRAAADATITPAKSAILIPVETQT